MGGRSDVQERLAKCPYLDSSEWSALAETHELIAADLDM
jgi:hypothetical protein